MAAIDFFALGMLEFSSIAKGVESADKMVKAADVTPLFFKTICPGKFLAGVQGSVAAVEAAIAAGKSIQGNRVVDSFVLANVHQDVFPALTGSGTPAELNALGIIETFSAASVILAADFAVKAAAVTLVDVRIAMGLGGKGYAYMSGDVAAVQAGARSASDAGLLVEQVVIPSPARAVWEQIL